MNLIKKLGLTFDDLSMIEYGQVMDMLIEKGNDDIEYKQLATQADFDRF